jgi:hypothetical protein
MADTDFRQSIFDLLSKWRGLDSLKTLFWTELNYDRVNEPISLQDWPQAARDPLAESPTIFAQAGEGGAFKVLYARLASDRLRLTDERAVVNRLLRDHPYALFIFSDRTRSTGIWSTPRTGAGAANREPTRASWRGGRCQRGQ